MYNKLGYVMYILLPKVNYDSEIICKNKHIHVRNNIEYNGLHIIYNIILSNGEIYIIHSILQMRGNIVIASL